MRLTLRTLLAYLDDILEPEDSEDIAKKVEESEFATNLVHRTRDCMRRLRLGVPPVVGRGLATDPNTVAEYLDNTLPTDRVPEFEKICLESDVHLAEVASGHQILTLVLGEPAEINPESRQRMYRLASHVDAPPVQADAPVSAAAAASPPALHGAAQRAKPEVPEYLRESSRSRLWPVAATVVIAALLTCGALMVFGPAQWRERVTALVPGSGGESPAENADAGAPTASDAQAAPAADLPTETVDGASADAMPSDAVPKTDADDPAEEPAEAMPAEDAAAPPAPEPGDGTKPQPADDKGPAREDADNTPAASAEPAAERAGAEAEGFGRYTSKKEVLLKYDAEAGDWKRLAYMAPLSKGDRLLSLPCFRPVLTLSTNISIQPDGAALLELVGWTDQGVPIVAIEYGRVLMMTVGKAGNALQVNLDERFEQLVFVDAESTLALEVRRVLPPGKDPSEGLAPLAVDLYVTSGLIRLRQGDAPVELQAPAQRALVGGGIEAAGADFPKWVTSEALDAFDHRAVTTLEPLLPPERPISLILKELGTERRREVRSLAIRSACYLGSFEACSEALNEKDDKTLWPTYIDELRSSVARSPEVAAKVRTAFDKQRNADAAALYRMLWGYSAEDLKNGADRDLVDALNHDSLDVRVLAFWNLQNITGLSNFGYYPGDLAKKRSSAVNAWREKLRQGKIMPRAASSTKPKAAAKASEKAPS